MSTRCLRLQRYAVSGINATLYSAYRVRVEVIEAEGLDTNVFVYRRGSPDPYTGETTDTFFTVASHVDLAETPVGAPAPGVTPPLFRLRFAELDFRTTRDADEFWSAVQQELANLILALNRLDELTLTDDLWIPSPPTSAGSSSSASSSQSR